MDNLKLINAAFPKSAVVCCNRFGKGCVNKTYSCRIRNPSKEIVLRIFPNNGWKSKKEAFLYDIIKKKTDVPVPKVYHSGKDYMILSMIKGNNICRNNKKLIKKAGEYLAKLHNIKFKSFGWIVGNDIKPKFSSWERFLAYDLNHKLKKLGRVLDKNLIEKSREYFDRNKGLLKIKAKPCLLHKDYHFSHIIADKGRITGIIDFEWAIAGHNELDIAKSISWMFEDDKKLKKIFLEGYRKHGTISGKFEKRKRLYFLLTDISSLLFSHELKNKKWFDYNLRKIKKTININP